MSDSNGNGRAVGRPPLFEQDPEILADLLKSIGLGMSDRDAATIAGIHYQRIPEWVKAYPAFAERIADARARGKRERLELLMRAARGLPKVRQLRDGTIVDEIEHDWRAAAWLLARQYPAEFSDSRKIEHSGNIGKATPEEIHSAALDLLSDPEVRGSIERNRIRGGALPAP
jgi:hypothetical protein